MTERFEKITNILEMWSEACPVVLQRGALLKDNATGKILLQFKFKNIASERIKAIEVLVKCQSVGGELLEEKEYSYLDLDLSRNCCIGDQQPIYLSNVNSRNFEIYIKSIYYSSEKKEEYNCRLRKYEDRPLIQEYGELADEVVRLYGQDQEKSSLFAPLFYTEKSWRCVCGQLNIEERCINCNSAKKHVEKLSDKEYLSEELKKYNEEREKQLAYEQAEREKKERELAQKWELRKKQLKKMSIIASCMILTIIIVVIGYNIISPIIKRNNAEKAYNKGEYDKAIEIYQDINKDGEYSEKIDLCKHEKHYHIAVDDITKEKYVDAIEYLEMLPDNYKDKGELLIQSVEGLANQFFDSKNYEECKTLLEKWSKTDMNIYVKSCYHLAIEKMNSQEYEEAITLLDLTGNYEDSESLKVNCANEIKYLEILTCLKWGQLNKAKEYLSSIPSNYKNASKFIALINQYSKYDREWVCIKYSIHHDNGRVSNLDYSAANQNMKSTVSIDEEGNVKIKFDGHDAEINGNTAIWYPYASVSDTICTFNMSTGSLIMQFYWSDGSKSANFG